MAKKITKEIIAEFISNTKIELASTHTRLCLPIINRIFRKMSAGIKFSTIKVENNFICDGHHRYIASLLAKFPLERISGTATSATTIVDWNIVSFDEDDWDTEADITLFNKRDAEFNNIPYEKVVELLK